MVKKGRKTEMYGSVGVELVSLGAYRYVTKSRDDGKDIPSDVERCGAKIEASRRELSSAANILTASAVKRGRKGTVEL
jgi:hypothetical protein